MMSDVFNFIILCRTFSFVFAKHFSIDINTNIFSSKSHLVTLSTNSAVKCAYLCNAHSACCAAELNNSCSLYSVSPSIETGQFIGIHLLLPVKKNAPICPSGWLQNGDFCFYFSLVWKSWSGAKKYCEGQNSILAEPMTEDDIEFIKTTARDKANTYWLGATDQEQESVWIWASTKSSLNLTDWHNKEPSNTLGKEHCLTVNKILAYEWNDAACDIELGFVCQMVIYV